MPNARQSFDETVARIALGRMRGEAQQVAEMRGLPADVRHANEEQELDLYDQWDEKVDPVVVLEERFAKHTKDGLPPDAALAEAIVETCAAGFKNRLKMAGAAGRTTLTEQCAYLERLAMKSRRRREQQQQQATEPEGADDDAIIP